MQNQHIESKNTDKFIKTLKLAYNKSNQQTKTGALNKSSASILTKNSGENDYNE